MKRIRKNKEAKAKVVKKPVKKVNDAKAVAKDISARGKKMFLTNRKTVSALKKLTKNLAKLITEANQTGDQKLVGRITKLFGYLGFNTDSDANKVTWCYDAKVKPMKAPKVKPEKKADEEKTEKKVRKPRKPRVEKKPPEQPAQQTSPTNDGDIPPANDTSEPAPEEIENAGNLPPQEIPVGDGNDLANVEETGSVDESDESTSSDEDEEDEDAEREHDDDDDDDDDEEKEPQSYEDGLADFRREAWGNDDFQRDDI